MHSKNRALLFLMGALVSIASLNKAVAQQNLSSQSFRVRPWAVGQSITLQTKTYQNGNLNNTETVTYSIVDQEEIKGKNYLWVEIEQTLGDGVTLTKKLQVRHPEDVDFENVLSMGVEHGLLLGNSFLVPRRVIQKMDLGQNKNFIATNEYEVSGDVVDKIEKKAAFSASQDLTSQYAVTPSQSVQVQAGSFKTDKFSSASPTSGATTVSQKSAAVSPFSEAWGSPDIPIWGLVKKLVQFQTLDGITVSQQTELVSYRESGAVSKIVENTTPVTVKQQKKRMDDFLRAHPEMKASQGTNDEK